MMDYDDNLTGELGFKGVQIFDGFARGEEANGFYKQLEYKISEYRFVRLCKYNLIDVRI